MAAIEKREYRMIDTMEGSVIEVQRWTDLIILKTGYRATQLQAFDARFIANALNEYADKLDPPEEG